MDMRSWRLVERELREAGFARSATGELRAELEKGARQVDVPFQSRFLADEVKGLLHLRRPEEGGEYALQGFDLKLRKAGHTDWLEQSFQQPSGAYTLQEAYNLLDGRPVYKTLGEMDCKPYEAWVKLDTDRRLENGNYARKYYHADDGFNLGEVLGRYPIKELSSPETRAALINSLQQGNLTGATFMGADGKETKLQISASIASKSLLVQDENGIRLSPERLAGRFDFPREGVVPAGVAGGQGNRMEVKQAGERQRPPRQGKRLRLQ